MVAMSPPETLTERLLARIPGGRRLVALFGRPDKRDFLLKMLPQGSVGAEIGVDKGAFSASILRIVRPKELHLIDPWKHEESDVYRTARYGGMVQGQQAEMDDRYEAVRARFASEIRSGQVTIHRSTSADALSRLPADFLDWVYIDGNHLYDFVKADLELSFERTKPGGYITGDDYREGGWWQGGVKKAVDEFIRDGRVEPIAIWKGQFVLRKL